MVHHAVCDGKGLLNFIKLVSTTYTQLIKELDYIPAQYKQYDRSIKLLLLKYKAIEKWRLMLSVSKIPMKGPLQSFPWSYK